MANDSQNLNFNAPGRIGAGEAQVYDSKAGQTYRSFQQRRQNIAYSEIQAKKKRSQELFSQANILLEGFDKDVNTELTEDKTKLREWAREKLKNEGINNETAAAINAASQNLQQKVNMSKAQKELVKTVRQKMNQNNFDKHFDEEATRDNIEEFMKLDIGQRSMYSKPLLVRKVDPYNAMSVPEETLSADLQKGGPRAKEWFQDHLTKNPDLQDWYVRGKEQGHWNTPEQAYTLWQRINDNHYKDPTGGSGDSVKYNEYGDPNKLDEAQKYVNPYGGHYLYGQQDAQMEVVTDIRKSKGVDKLGEVTYKVQGQPGWQEGDIGPVEPVAFMTNKDDDKTLLYAYGQVEEKVEPTFAEISAAQTDSKYAGVPRDELVKELTETKKRDKFFFIDLTAHERYLNDQMKKRGNLLKAHFNQVAQTNFLNYSEEQLLEDIDKEATRKWEEQLIKDPMQTLQDLLELNDD